MQNIQGSINLEILLDSITFPTTKAVIVDHAIQNEASEEALDLLHAIERKEYASLVEINAQLGLIEPLPEENNQFSSEKADFGEPETQEEAVKRAQQL